MLQANFFYYSMVIPCAVLALKYSHKKSESQPLKMIERGGIF